MMETPKPSSLRKYIFEYCVLGLCAAVSFLYYQLNELNNYVRNTLTEQVLQSKQALNESTRTLEKATTIFMNESNRPR